MGVRNIAVTITGDGSSLSRALLRGSGEVDGFTKKVETSNARAALSWKTAGLAAKAGIAAVAVGLAASAVAAAQFETRMRNVNSLLHVNEAQFRGLSAATLDLSRHLPQSANVLAEGLYDITSSGFAGSDALLVLQKSAEAASAGLTTTANSAQAITAVLNAYGLSAASAGDVSDTLFQTVNLGVISFEQLTGVIGDVVGTAAAAKVPIDDVGAAIATMTLNGLSAEESGTSLNRVLQSLIQPSAALATLYKQLGFESGAAALQSKGLQGVMEDIRKASGGNVTTLLQLFPEIRAARGALALMSNEGQNYQRVSKGIADENARQGATHRALAEQMKAAGAQWQLFVNQARAGAIVTGTKVLPVFIAFLGGVREAANEALPLLHRGITAVTPLFEALWKTGENVVEILGHLLTAIEPVAAALLSVAGVAVLGALTGLAKVLETITSLAAHHQTAVIALGAAYAATLVPSLVAAAAAFGRMAFESVVLGLNAVLGAADGASAGVRGLAASMVTLQGVATLGVAAALFLLVNGTNNLRTAQAQARAEAAKTAETFDAFDTKKAQAAINELSGQAVLSAKVGEKFQGVWGQALLGLDAVLPRSIAGIKTGAGSFTTLAYQGQAAQEQVDALNEKMLNFNGNVVKLAADTGLSTAAIMKLAQTQKIDLTNDFYSEKGIAARKQVLEYLRDLEKQSRTSGDVLAQAAGMDLDALQELAKTLADVQKKVGEVFAGDTNVLGTFDPAAAADAQKQAAEGVTQAEQDLHDARARASADGKISVSDSIAIRKAQQAVADAQANVSKTAKEQPATLQAAYTQTIALANRFAADIQTAEQRGLDPAVVTRLLELGPKQAEPILQQLVNDHSGRLIAMVNKSEATLSQISARVVEVARLTALATNASTDALSKNLPQALRISGEAAAEGSKATVQSVAKALGIPDAQVRQIAQQFGITLRDNIQKGLSSKPLTPPRIAGTPPNTPASRDRRYATGGMITGPGGPTDDRVRILASPGEWIHRAAAVNYYGVDFMDRLNRMQLPRFADGGLVGRSYAGAGATGGLAAGDVAAIATALSRMAPRVTRHENTIYAHDYEDFKRQALDDEALSNLAGG